MIHSLFDAARKAQASQDVKAIVVTGANGRFSAGFDIAQFQKSSGGGGVDMRYGRLSTFLLLLFTAVLQPP